MCPNPIIIVIIIIIIILIIATIVYFNNCNNSNSNNFKERPSPVYPQLPFPPPIMNSLSVQPPFSNKLSIQPPYFQDRNYSHQKHSLKPYLGSIDDQIFSNLALNENTKYGFTDLSKNENHNSPDGNPFNLMNTSAPVMAPIPVDEEANADTLDFDKLNTYQAKWRNDATRATVGTMNRLRDMKPYLTEELEETENQQWWGNHEL